MANTSLRQRADFPEVKDKILNEIQVSSDSEYFGIAIRFQDNTTLNFTVEPCVAVCPVLSDWTGGEQKILKKYKSVRSKIQRS